ncbi:VOC family protein [Streptomyces sp. NPDC005549]|uniref:VOC family protein n=1 Tax=Streptomyces sp. NPDC005549 TaxID=3154888 RepID=UPI0033B75426
MNLASPALVFDVPDMQTSSDFAQKHLGFQVTAASNTFTVLEHEDHGLRLIFGPLAADAAPTNFRQLQVGFLVTDVNDHWERLKDQVTVGDPVQTLTLPTFREGYFQIADPNGVVYRLMAFVD